MKNTLKEILKMAVLGSTLVVVQAFAFSEPSTSAPGGTAVAPVNVGGVVQEKTGGLVVGAFRSRLTALLATDGGNVGIGTIAPTQKLDVGTGKVSANDYWIAAINEWASELKFTNQFTVVRSQVVSNDSVIYCPASYPILIACDTTDDQAPAAGPTSLAGYCENDGPCKATSAAPPQFRRGNLGDQMTYHERVTNSSGRDGCWAYDYNGSHMNYRLELICIKK